MNIEKRMGKDEAHDEANLIKAEVNLNRNPNSIRPKWVETMLGGMKEKESILNRFVEHTATPEEYDKALQEIEELKKLAEDEPAIIKALYKIGRVSTIVGELVIYDLLKSFGEIGHNEEDENKVVTFRNNLWQKKLDDASYQLKRMKDAGERYSKAELAK